MKESRQGGAHRFNIGMSLRASATSVSTVGMWIEQTHVNLRVTRKRFPALRMDLCAAERNDSKTHHASLKKKKKKVKSYTIV